MDHVEEAMHEMIDGRDAEIKRLRSALMAMLTFYGMDEQRGEISGIIHDQARAALNLQ